MIQDGSFNFLLTLPLSSLSLCQSSLALNPQAHQPSLFSRRWIICWGGITPVMITALLLLTMANHVPVSYNNYTYPDWAIAVGWGLASLSLIPIPALAIYNVARAPVSVAERSTAPGGMPAACMASISQ